MRRPIVLYRQDRLDPDQFREIEAAQDHFAVVHERARCSRQLVIGRYSVLPFYRELEADLAFNGCRLINSFAQHDYVASFSYYHDVADLTFETWNCLAECGSAGPFVIKGRTNSRKHQWSTHMFAETRTDAVRVIGELNNDSMIGRQGLVIRKYEPLVTYEIGVGGMPFTNEWRFFFFREHLLSHGFYWSLMDQPGLACCTEAMIKFAKDAAWRIKDHVNFFVLDVAEKAAGGFVLVEVNDGQMSGLSLNDPAVLWGNLAKILKQEG